MNKRTAGVLVAIGLAASACSSSAEEGRGGAAASCAGPVVSARGSSGVHGPVVVRPGQKLELRGRYFLSDCYDTGQSGSPPPIRAVHLTFVAADGKRTPLATAHPSGALGRFATEIRVPTTAAPGHGRITATSAAGMPVVVRT
jgi:hypothetical protein